MRNHSRNFWAERLGVPQPRPHQVTAKVNPHTEGEWAVDPRLSNGGPMAVPAAVRWIAPLLPVAGKGGDGGAAAGIPALAEAEAAHAPAALTTSL